MGHEHEARRETAEETEPARGTAAGKRSLIEVSEDLCKSKPRGEIRLAAQNGRVQNTKPPIPAPCGKR